MSFSSFVSGLKPVMDKDNMPFQGQSSAHVCYVLSVKDVVLGCTAPGRPGPSCAPQHHRKTSSDAARMQPNQSPSIQAYVPSSPKQPEFHPEPEWCPHALYGVLRRAGLPSGRPCSRGWTSCSRTQGTATPTSRSSSPTPSSRRRRTMWRALPPSWPLSPKVPLDSPPGANSMPRSQPAGAHRLLGMQAPLQAGAARNRPLLSPEHKQRHVDCDGGCVQRGARTWRRRWW